MDNSNFWWQAAGVDPGPGPGPDDPGDPIGQSLRFRGAQSLSGHTGGSGTASVWIKRAKLGAAQTVMSGIAFDAGDKLNSSVALFRDPSAWMHVVVNANGTYVNGISVASGSAISAGTIGASCELYLAQFYFIDGQLLEPTAFGRYNANGVWVPVDYSGSFGSTGFHLDFADPSNIGKDISGNGNDFTATGFETTDTSSPNYDVMRDSPTQNYATINPLYPGASISNANLTTANATGKPTILGLPGNGWDGTEAGWTTTGDVDFGQRTAADEISTRTMPAATIRNGRDHFQAITDTGANILTEAQNTFPNGLWWIKDRVNSNQHQLVDSVNGTSAVITSPAGSVTAYAAPTGSSVAWCWNAANTDGGFSITNGTHGLGTTPAFVIDRALNVWHQSLPAGQGLSLKTSAAAAAQAWTVDGTTVSGPGGGTYYSWAEIPNYSAFGSYTGNNNADGPFVYTGFRPAFVMFKNTSSGYWQIRDSTRDPDNPSTNELYPNVPDKENTHSSTRYIDLLSNGFKLRASATPVNGNTIVYAAFAENPFQAPATAR